MLVGSVPGYFQAWVFGSLGIDGLTNVRMIMNRCNLQEKLHFNSQSCFIYKYKVHLSFHILLQDLGSEHHLRSRATYPKSL